MIFTDKLNTPGNVAGVSVEGEVWEIDAHTLKSLDRLEGCPGHYSRGPVKLIGFSAYVETYYVRWDRVADCEYTGDVWPFSEINRQFKKEITHGK